jgi:hypothetical protein
VKVRELPVGETAVPTSSPLNRITFGTVVEVLKPTPVRVTMVPTLPEDGAVDTTVIPEGAIASAAAASFDDDTAWRWYAKMPPATRTRAAMITRREVIKPRCVVFISLLSNK